MNEQQADALIDELHELNKTLKTIVSSQERQKVSSKSIQKALETAIMNLSSSHQADPKLL
ncbi:hypothetical protein [Lentilactobacillus hilgardii]|uniref:Uncharacterized protein n=1 Tax=Lentilactobacillus hilgardii TaxID=1588 RepID=A0A6P1E1Q0_LENHI|nr:hypothetical protein [Lentilactobacillus hilgardii]QHB51226.1 hypothetical protein GQR93_02795 [Lentilactobacillus hilgardii]